MGIYRDKVLPRIVDKACGMKSAEPLRARVCAGLLGQVLEPMQKRVFGGCHLTRPITELLTSAGFTISEVDVFYEDGAPKILGADSLGVATRAPVS